MKLTVKKFKLFLFLFEVNPRIVVRPVTKKFCNKKSGTRTLDLNDDAAGLEPDQSLSSADNDSRGFSEGQDLDLVKYRVIFR